MYTVEAVDVRGCSILDDLPVTVLPDPDAPPVSATLRVDRRGAVDIGLTWRDLGVDVMGYEATALQCFRRLGCEVVLERHFPDHHPFTLNEIAGLARAARAKGARFVLTTQKDAARIDQLGEDAWPGTPPLHVLRAEFAFVDRERAFWDAVKTALER